MKHELTFVDRSTLVQCPSHLLLVESIVTHRSYCAHPTSTLRIQTAMSFVDENVAIATPVVDSVARGLQVRRKRSPTQKYHIRLVSVRLFFSFVGTLE